MLNRVEIMSSISKTIHTLSNYEFVTNREPDTRLLCVKTSKKTKDKYLSTVRSGDVNFINLLISYLGLGPLANKEVHVKDISIFVKTSLDELSSSGKKYILTSSSDPRIIAKTNITTIYNKALPKGCRHDGAQAEQIIDSALVFRSNSSTRQTQTLPSQTSSRLNAVLNSQNQTKKDGFYKIHQEYITSLKNVKNLIDEYTLPVKEDKQSRATERTYQSQINGFYISSFHSFKDSETFFNHLCEDYKSEYSFDESSCTGDEEYQKLTQEIDQLRTEIARLFVEFQAKYLQKSN